MNGSCKTINERDLCDVEMYGAIRRYFVLWLQCFLISIPRLNPLNAIRRKKCVGIQNKNIKLCYKQADKHFLCDFRTRTFLLTQIHVLVAFGVSVRCIKCGEAGLEFLTTKHLGIFLRGTSSKGCLVKDYQHKIIDVLFYTLGEWNERQTI